MQCRSVNVLHPDGRTLSVKEWSGGSQAGRSQVCFLIHGFGDGAHIWNEFAPLLTPHYRTLAVDLRGHGDSSWDSAGRYSPRTHTADICFLMDSLSLKRFVIVGHSLGANIAIRVAATHADRVAGSVLVDFSPEPSQEAVARVMSDFKAAMRTYSCVSEYLSLLTVQRPLVPSATLHRLANDALREHAGIGFRLKCDPSLSRFDDGSQDTASLWTMLRMISSPVLIARGAGSAVLSRGAGERMLTFLRDGRMRTIDCAGHAVMIDNAEQFAETVLPFLSELAASLCPPNRSGREQGTSSSQ